MSATELSAGLERCTGRVAQLADEEKRTGTTVIRRRIGGRLTIPTPGETSKLLAAERGGQVEIPDHAYFFRCGSSSITCACEFISGLSGGALSRLLCACSHVEGTCIGTHSELNARTIENLNKIKDDSYPAWESI